MKQLPFDINEWKVARRLLLGLSLAAVLIGSAQWWPYTIDDSYITYQYARNLALGRGAVFNAGEHVEGYSSPGWMFLLALTTWMGLDPVVTSKVLGMAAALALVLVLYAALRRADCQPIVGGLACLVLATTPTLYIYAPSGMETLWYALAVAAAAFLTPAGNPTWRTGATLSLALVAVVVLRPEAILLAILLSLYWFHAHRVPEIRRSLLACWILITGLFLCRFLYYGHFLPNTYVAKASPIVNLIRQGHLKHAVLALLDSVTENLFPALGELGGTAAVVLAFLGAAVRRGGQARFGAALSAIAGFVFILYARHDWMTGHRFAIPYAAPFLFLAALGASAMVGLVEWLRRRRSAAVAILLTLTWCAWSVAKASDHLAQYRFERVNAALDGAKYLRIGDWLREHARPGDRVLAFEVGAISYGSGLYVIDHEGLVTPEAAAIIQAAEGGLEAVRLGRNPEGTRRLARYCADQAPEWWLMRAYTSASPTVGEPVSPEFALFELERAILEELDEPMDLAAAFDMSLPNADGNRRKYLLLKRRG